MTNGNSSREIILDILLEILEKGGYSHIVLGQALSKYQYLDKQERAFISRTVEGTVEYTLQLDYVINSYSSVKVKKMKPVIRTLLRMSVYQILYMDRVPDSAVCNEAVKLAQKRKFTGLKGFVNGVLRNISRNKEQLKWPDDSVRYSMPSWILDMWKGTYGEETAVSMVKAFLKPSRTAVRCNLNRASKQEIMESLKNQGVTVEETPLSAAVLYLSKYDYLESLDAFAEGLISVQDMSSSFVGEIADPKEGDLCLDVCGAPGGKGLHAADILGGTGMVEIRDISEAKVSLIEENIGRSGLTNLRAAVCDALSFDPDSEEAADVVIADLPCSGLGIIGRKPDIKYNMTPEKLHDLACLQREILSVVQRYVKPGGTLVYSTCTVNREENEDNMRWFLEHFPFEPVNLKGRLGEKLSEPSMESGYIQFLPGIHPCDGFFIAVMKKCG